MKTLPFPLAFVWLLAALPTGAGGPSEPDAGPRYTLTDLGTLGGPNSEAWGINDAGQVVGRGDLAPDGEGNVYYHAFLYENGAMTDLGTIGPGCDPASSNSWAYDINESGQIVGQTCANGRDPRAFLWSDGVMRDIGTGDDLSRARAINAVGDVVGTNGSRAFLYRGNVMQDFAAAEHFSSEASDINDGGTVVGFLSGVLYCRAFLYVAPDITYPVPDYSVHHCDRFLGINNAGKVIGTLDGQGYLYNQGKTTSLGGLGFGFSFPNRINDYDEIVGESEVRPLYSHAFLYRDGAMVDLDSQIPDHPEWELNDAKAINAAGQIVGYGTVDGHRHGFLLTPVPAPPTAVDDAYATPFEVPLVVPARGVLANDDRSGTSAITADLDTSVSHGTLALHPDGGFTYTPSPGYSGADAFAYRAVTDMGASNLATVSLTVGDTTSVQPPTGLYTHSIAGNVVSLRWTPPASGPRPTAYSIEGGVNPGEVGAAISTGSASPIYTLPAPAGSFYVRVRSIAGDDRSGPSAEIRLHVGVPVPPSAPASLTSVVNGSSLNLAWRNTFGGGPASGVVLEARAGSDVWYFPLGLTDTFATAGVPAGSYALRVWAVNATGVSDSSNTVVVTFPGACSGPPAAPSGFLAYAIGRTVFAIWDPPAAGPAATSYELAVLGSYVGSFPTLGRALNGTVHPGSYDLSVVARNACGWGSPTPTQTVTIR